jgi:MFS family permease
MTSARALRNDLMSAIDRPVQKARWGTLVLFLLHGLIVGTWISRIPAFQIALKLNNAVLGLTLLSATIGAILSIPATGKLIDRYGSRRVSITSTLLLCGALAVLPWVFNAMTLATILLPFGATAAAMDVSMNAHGVEVEKRLGSPTMSRFHGMFSLGAMTSAGAGGAVAARGVAPWLHFDVSSVVYAVATLLVAPLLLRTRDDFPSKHRRLPFSNIPPVLLALSGIGFCILLSEGAMADWTAVYMRQVLAAGPGTAAAAYSVFSAAMALFRFVGDWITSKFGPARTIYAGSLVAGCGLLWALSMRSPTWALPAFGAVGAGFSVIIPLVFGSAGRVENISPGPGIATVTGVAYVGFIVGPATIGFVAQILTLRYALGIVVLCCVISALLSRWVARLKGPVGPGPGPELY